MQSAKRFALIWAKVSGRLSDIFATKSGISIGTFWSRITAKEFVELFGDYNQPPYAEALEAHYKNGPPANWSEHYISAYASHASLGRLSQKP